MSRRPAIEPDTKDWTWVLERACPDCGFDAVAVDRADLGRLLRESAAGLAEALRGPGATTRPRPDVWSATEYACHVRDVHRLFDERLRLMLAEHDPEFENWDQDSTAVEQRYDLAEPAEVSGEVVEAAAAVAATYDAVTDEQWQRPGRRSNGDAFTVESLGRYHLHDALHHLWDVTP